MRARRRHARLASRRTLRPGSAEARLQGTIVSADGAPVGGARLTVAEGRRQGATTLPGEVFSGPDGRFALAGARRSGALLLVRAEGFVPEVVAAPPHARRLVVVLAPAGAIQGTLRDARGAPLAGARVRAVSREAMDLGEACADGAGRFAITALRPGRYAVHAVDAVLPAAWVEVGPGASPHVALRASATAKLALC
ncbi:MAG: carboxypeptidase-like regulatory domain-containing protein [Anaeromyxobacteraceae bacterium]